MLRNESALIDQGMHAKMFKLRSLTAGNEEKDFIDLDLEFEGDRAFVVWDSMAVGNFLLKARLEIDPALLQEAAGRGCDYIYRGELVLPRPEDN